LYSSSSTFAYIVLPISSYELGLGPHFNPKIAETLEDFGELLIASSGAAMRCQLDQLDVVLWLVDLVEIGRARMGSPGRHINGRVTVTLAKCAGRSLILANCLV
jgi:hypothetical protein